MIALELVLAVQLAQAQAPIRILTLGTSHTARGGWQEPLARRLKACLGKPVDTVNRGKSGANSHWGVEQAEAAAAERPDIVLIEFSANDASLHNGVSLAEARDNITTIVNELRAKAPDVRIILMAMNPMSGLRGALRPSLDRYDDLYRELSGTLRVEFVDHRPAWRTLGDSALIAAIPDGVHPNESNAAAIIVPALARAICDQQSGPT